jgi:acetyl esterase/lipase
MALATPVTAADRLRSTSSERIRETWDGFRTHDGPPRDRPPLLLLIPGGGFVSLYSAQLTWVAKIARRQGFDPRTIAYTLDDPLGGWIDVRYLARRGRRNGREVYAYGESAGGDFAALLAEKGLALAASVNAPPSDLTEWSLPGAPDFWQEMAHHGPRTRLALSPALHPSRKPILVQQSPTDQVVPAGMNRGWAARDARVRLQTYAGNHVFGADFGTYGDNVRNALAFLKRQRKARARASGHREGRGRHR